MVGWMERVVGCGWGWGLEHTPSFPASIPYAQHSLRSPWAYSIPFPTTTHNRISEVILEAVIIRGLYVVLVCCEL